MSGMWTQVVVEICLVEKHFSVLSIAEPCDCICFVCVPRRGKLAPLKHSEQFVMLPQIPAMPRFGCTDHGRLPADRSSAVPSVICKAILLLGHIADKIDLDIGFWFGSAAACLQGLVFQLPFGIWL